jgi:hypothetical protein
MMISTLRTTALAAAVAMTLVACGGGGDDGVAVTPTPTAPAGGGNPGGNPAATSATWTRTSLAANTWHWTATNPSGSMMIATAIPGSVYLSTDQGATWTAPAGLPTASWISADVSDDGRTIYVVGFNGSMYRSLDAGATWARVDAAINAGQDLGYESVTVSADGTRVVAAVMSGAIYVSSNGEAATPTFTQATAGGAALTGSWRAVDSDATGQRVIAVSHDGDVYASTNGGTSFTAVPVTVGGTAVQDGWYRAAMSRDGATVALVGNEQYGTGVTTVADRSSGLYVGRFAAGAWTFTRGSTVEGNYTRVAIADNGTMAATLSGAGATNTGGGQILLSLNNGTSFAPLNAPTTDTVWRSIALTGDGTRAVLAAGTFFGATGGLYTGTRP